jgi:RNA polymerase sigma factor (sigma-70 family)
MGTGGKVCSRCKESKPLEGFSRDRRNRLDGRRTACSWCESPRRKKLKGNQDHHRRILSDASPRLKGDESQLAYVRGFLKGRTVQDQESERVAACKDLVFRIASDMARRGEDKGEVSFEEMVGYGYEGLLEGVRSYRADAKHPFRAHAAKRIRYGILDRLRQKGTTWRLGGRYSTFEASPKTITDPEDGIVGNPVDGGEMEPRAEDPDSTDVIDRTVSRITKYMSPRHGEIIRMRLEGLTNLEIGVKLQLTESRICQIRREVQVWQNS